MKNFDTMTEAISDLQKRGYTLDFNLANEFLECKQNSCKLRADEFEIDEVYRFEGETDPGDENIVYGISSLNDNSRGILVNAYGMYSDSAANEIVSKLNKHLK